MPKSKIKDQKVVENPLLQLAHGLVSSQNEEVWKEKPVDIVEFIESPKFLNQKWNGYRGCRPKILDIAVNVMNDNIREVILLLGKGSGKDYISAICHLYGIYKCLCMYNPHSYYGLAPSPIYFVNTARNDTQAKKVFFTQFRVLLAECPWFAGKYSAPGLQNISFMNNIEALSANSQAFAWLGFNTIQWVGDELAFFLESDNDDESESRAEECWLAAYGSCKTRFPKHYKMIGITTPRYDDDFVMKKFEELKTRQDGYSVQAATWDINPNLTKNDFKFDLETNYRRTMRDFGAQPQGVIESFWPEPEKLESMVCETCKNCPIYQNRKVTSKDFYSCFDYDDCKANPYRGNGVFREWFIPPKGEFNEYWMHFDLAKSKDRLGFALGRLRGITKVELDAYKIKLAKKKWEDETDVSEKEKFEEKPLIKIDMFGWVSNKINGRDSKLLSNGEYHYTKVKDLIIVALKKKGFNIVGVTFDQYQSHDIKQQLEDAGFETDLISLDRTDEIPVAAKHSILEGRVEFPYSALLMDEAKYLKHINAKKVDHSKKSSKDLWDAFAGTIWNCDTRLLGQGTSVDLTLEEED